MTDARDDFVTDAEIARRWRVNDKAARTAIKAFELNPISVYGQLFRFPKKDGLFPGKRYWPAVKAFVDARAGLSVVVPEPLDGEEHLGKASENRRRTRPRLAHAR